MKNWKNWENWKNVRKRKQQEQKKELAIFMANLMSSAAKGENLE